MLASYIGFHGTSLENCRNIIRQKGLHWSIDEDEWLGKGIYFFEGHSWYAVWWARDYKGHKLYAVIKALISVEEDRILDLTVPENVDLLDAIRRDIRSQRKKKDRPIPDATVIRWIYDNLRKFDVVKGIFDDKKYVPRRLTDYRPRIWPHQVQLCVCNGSCISEIQQVE